MNLNPGLANQIGVPVQKGIFIVRVFPDFPAAEAGLQEEEDVIVQLGKEPIHNTGELSKFLLIHLPGETVTVVFFRGSEQMTAQVILRERPR